MVKGSSGAKGGARAAAAGRAPGATSSSAGPRIATAIKAEAGPAPDAHDLLDQGEEEEKMDVEDDEDVEDWEARARPVTWADPTDKDEKMSMLAGRTTPAKPLARQLDSDLAEVGDDSADEADEWIQARPPRHGDTPSANKLLGTAGVAMVEKSLWLRLFAPVPSTQARWIRLRQVLERTVETDNVALIAAETIALLESMGFKCTEMPSAKVFRGWDAGEAAAELAKWKQLLLDEFGVTGSVAAEARRIKAEEQDPRKAPLPATPRGKSPYRAIKSEQPRKMSHKWQEADDDEDMATPKRSPTERNPRRYSTGYRERSYVGDSDADADDDDPCREIARQIRRSLEEDEDDWGSAPSKDRPPLRKMAKFRGERNQSEKALHWLKKFIYEMKGSGLKAAEWCEVFALCLEGNAQRWVRQLPKKTQRTWTLLCESFMEYYCRQNRVSPHFRYYQATRQGDEHLCDFILRLNGYARQAKIRYEHGGQDGRSHVQQFLLQCGDDELLKKLWPMGIKDIATVEQFINDEETAAVRRTDRDRLGSRMKAQDDRRQGSASRGFERGDNSRRPERREQSERRDTRAPASVNVMTERSLWDDMQPRARPSVDYDSDLSYGSESSIASDHWNGFTSDPDYGQVFAAERDETPPTTPRFNRQADDTPRADQRQSSGWRGDDRHRERYDDRRQRGNSRDRRPDGRTYGPCAVCGSPNHSAHFCPRRCKFCKQDHPVGRCELHQQFEQLAKFVRTKYNKDSIPAELHSLFPDLN